MMGDSAPDFRPFNPEGELSVSRRRLPHWDQPGATAFVTFRLGDSIPREKLLEWRRQREGWLAMHPSPPPLTEAEWGEYHRLFDEKMHRWLDAGYGSCLLRDPAAAGAVVETLHHFDGRRYWLGDYAVMPNHAHLLVVVPEKGLSGLLHTWKGYSAKVINRQRGRTGPLWMSERFDHLVRSEAQLHYYRVYIQENPEKAGLKAGEFALGEGRLFR